MPLRENIKKILYNPQGVVAQSWHFYGASVASFAPPVGQLSRGLEKFIAMKDHHIKDSPSKVLREFTTATGKQEDKYHMQTSIPMGSDLVSYFSSPWTRYNGR